MTRIKLSSMVLTHSLYIALTCSGAHATERPPIYKEGPIPSVLAQPETSASPLEKFYSNKSGYVLTQFGYDIFSYEQPSQHTLIASTSGNYEIAQGDELQIIIRGQKNETTTHVIDGQGQLIIDDLPPIIATGLTLSALKERLNQEITSWPNTSIYVSLTKFRQIEVITLGHIHKPGRITLNSASSLIDAIQLSHGIEKTGSLRNITLLRDGQKHTVDLYDILLGHNDKADITLQNGDRIIVPAIGNTIALSGDIKREGIFEIHSSSSLEEINKLSGGPLTQGDIRYIKSSPNGDNDITETSGVKIHDGDVLYIKRAEDKAKNTITLSGHTTQIGKHDLKKNPRVSNLLSTPSIYKDGIYPLFALIKRTSPQSLLEKYIAISPTQITSGTFDISLQNNDEIILFSMDEIFEYLATPIPDSQKETDTHIKQILTEHTAQISGAIRNEGLYPIANGTDLADIITAAGGTTLEANTSNIEITSAHFGTNHQTNGASGTTRKNINLYEAKQDGIKIHPSDSIRVHTKTSKIAHHKVTIQGEVLSPGEYDLLPNDTYASLIERAGGLTQQAYPNGTIFSRASERKREEKRYKDKARDLELQLALLLDSKDADKRPDMTQVTLIQNLISQLNNAEALGRITIQPDPSILKSDPAQDLLLESGDKIYIPKRPMTVRVVGEVLSPANLHFKNDKDVNDYINEAGGTSYYADKDRTFIIYPDGSAQPVDIGAWVHNPVKLIPGATIMVPKDPKPFDFLETAKDISHILSNLAITGIYLDEIGDD